MPFLETGVLHLINAPTLKQIQNPGFWFASLASLTLSAAPAQAQLIEDTAPSRALGTQIVPLTPTIDGIRGGVRRGQNLFHSFQEFNIDTNRGVYFDAPAGVQNILSRVTGGNASQILGVLGTREFLPNSQFAPSTATLFVINPNGIIFGPGARLDVGGSFVATTANALQFGNFGNFSASQPAPPSPLLTINPSAFLFNQIRPGNITNASNVGLQPGIGKSLLLVGGDINLVNQSRLQTIDGRIELGGLAEPGVIGLASEGDNFRLEFPANVARANLSIIGGSRVGSTSTGETGGDITVYAQNVTVSGQNTGIVTVVAPGTGAIVRKAGDVNINATGAFQISESGVVVSGILTPGSRSGNIRIEGQNVEIISGSGVSSLSLSQGNSGNVSIQARDRISLSRSLITTSIFSLPGFEGIGNGGDINLQAQVIDLKDNAQILTTNFFAKGNAGNIRVRTFDSLSASDDVALVTSTRGQGNAGNIILRVDNNLLISKSALQSSTFSQGNAGNIDVQVANQIRLNNAFIVSNVQSADAVGNGGDVTVKSGSIIAQNGSQINAFTRGQGNAGNVTLQARDEISFEGISDDGDRSASLSTVELGGTGKSGNLTIDTQRLTIRDGALVSASTSDQGSAGNLTIRATNLVEVLGTSPDGILSRLAADVNEDATGNGGNLTIDTKSLVVRDGAQVSVSTRGAGNAGNLTIRVADSIELSGESPSVNGEIGFPGGLFAQVDLNGKGQGGNLTLETRRLSVSNGSKIQAATFGDGDAGNLFIRADEIDVFATRLSTFTTSINAGVTRDPRTVTDPKGKGGNLTIETGRLSIQSTTAEGVNLAEVTVDTAGQGNAGRLLVQARDLVEVVGENSFLSADVTRTATGRGGDLIVGTRRLSVRDGGQISASTFRRTTGNAGNLTVQVSDSVEVVNGGSIAVSSAGRGDAGKLTITAPIIRLDNRGKILAETRSGQGGDVTLNVQGLLLLRNGSQISTTAGTAQAGGDGGNITINAPNGFVVGVKSENSDITANAFTGSGGRVNITAQGIYGLQFRPQLTEFSDITASSTFGLSGTVTLTTPNVDPSRGLVQLPVDLVDPATQLDQRCGYGAQNQRTSSFTMTGRGGLAEDPTQLLVPGIGEAQWVDGKVRQAGGKGREAGGRRQEAGGDEEIVEANAILRLPDGRVELVAIAPVSSPAQVWRSLDCATGKR
jgi:filamentous hemagglutinin family protein